MLIRKSESIPETPESPLTTSGLLEGRGLSLMHRATKWHAYQEPLSLKLQNLSSKYAIMLAQWFVACI